MRSGAGRVSSAGGGARAPGRALEMRRWPGRRQDGQDRREGPGNSPAVPPGDCIQPLALLGKTDIIFSVAMFKTTQRNW